MLPSFWARDNTEPQLHIDLCTMLDQLWQPDTLGRMTRLFPQHFGSGGGIAYMPQNARCPAAFFHSWGNNTMYLIGGTQGRTHYATLINGWRRMGAATAVHTSFNPAFLDGANRMLEEVNPFQANNPRNYYIVGHSYGGAIAQVLGWMAGNVGIRPARLISYGSPRPGQQVAQRALQNLGNARYYISNDPVRFMPPHSDEIPSLIVASPSDLVQGMNRSIQMPLGFAISPTGVITQDEVTAASTGSVFVEISNYMDSSSGFAATQHYLGAYIDRFNMALGNRTVRPRLVEPGELDDPLVLTNAARRRLVTIGEALVLDELANPMSPSRQIIVQRAGSSGVPFKPRREGYVWVVKQGEDIVAVGPGKRAAKRISRHMNAAARM